jgi:hypothetical protein
MTMRELMTYGVARTEDSARCTLDYLYELMDKEGPFDGIVGYSEGATIAGTLLLHEQMRQREEGRVPMLKCALFFGGWPPMTPELDGIVLSDQSELTIEVPTTHISRVYHSCLYDFSDSILQLGHLTRIFTVISRFTTSAIQIPLSFSIMQRAILCLGTSTW